MARQFTAASSQYLTNTTLTVPARPVTMACWFRPSSIGAAQVLMSFSDAAGNNILRLLVAASGVLQAQEFNNPTNGLVGTVGTLTASVWAFCAVVFTSATSRTVYLNTEAVTDTTNVTATGLDRLNVGALAGPTTFANGALGEVAIWTIALTVSDLAALARGVPVPRVRGVSLVPWGYWSLNGGASPEPDRGSAGNALTLQASPPVSAFTPPLIRVATDTRRRGRRG